MKKNRFISKFGQIVIIFTITLSLMIKKLVLGIFLNFKCYNRFGCGYNGVDTVFKED